MIILQSNVSINEHFNLMSYFFYFKLCVNIFWPQLAPSSLTFLQFCSMILQRPRIIVGYAGLEPGTSTPEFWRATVLMSHTFSMSSHFSMSSNIFKLLKSADVTSKNIVPSEHHKILFKLSYLHARTLGVHLFSYTPLEKKTEM